jgi:hypothetical protein
MSFINTAMNKLNDIKFCNLQNKKNMTFINQEFDTEKKVDIYISDNFTVIANIETETFSVNTTWSNINIDQSFINELNALNETFLK